MQFKDFGGIKILVWFLDNPTKKIHFKDLCRQLKFGPPTVKKYCDEFVKFDWLEEERKANLRIFSLNNKSFVVKSIKRAYFLEKLRELGIEKIANDNILSLALYGSYASGDYDERSDVDLIIIGRRENVDYKKLEQIKRKVTNIQFTIFSLEKWENNKHKDAFMDSVLRNNILLKGVSL